MNKLVIVTTRKDTSLCFFNSQKITAAWDIQVLLYEGLLLTEVFPHLTAEYLYLRDPFNSGLSPEKLRPLLNQCFQKNLGKKYIDNLTGAEDIYLEDKWLQYGLWKEFMPPTELASLSSHFPDPVLYKKRISSRAKDILFIRPAEDLSNHIAQKRLTIKEEYRVLEVAKRILPKILIKSSKTEGQKVKTKGSVRITPDLECFVSRIQPKHHFDLVGYDIARTVTGKLFLIEVNRSPQISSYVRETGINPFEQLLGDLR